MAVVRELPRHHNIWQFSKSDWSGVKLAKIGCNFNNLPFLEKTRIKTLKNAPGWTWC